jgi:hypothetical protein
MYFLIAKDQVSLYAKQQHDKILWTKR